MRAALITSLTSLVAVGLVSSRVGGQQPSVPPPQALLDQYCITCHNQKLKTGGLELDKLDLGSVGNDEEIWEKVARKLRAGLMPTGLRPPLRTRSIARRQRIPTRDVRRCTA
jgi:hypothetical protein